MADGCTIACRPFEQLRECCKSGGQSIGRRYVLRLREVSLRNNLPPKSPALNGAD
ncbi:hypothetical protein GCM10022207_89350 [Streptomyces lannensis]|uniref:Uncharacterized protein n=1 Tax=Streptomyces lannensis TaxID=766498 RepID=A0ABP7LR72_9ACTN